MHKFKLKETVIINSGPDIGIPAVIKQLQKGLVYKLELPDGEIVYYSEISLTPPENSSTIPINHNIRKKEEQ